MKNNEDSMVEYSEEQIVQTLFAHRKHNDHLHEELADTPDKAQVRITTAKPLSDQDKEKVITALGQALLFDPEAVQFKVDPRLIGGIRVQSRSYYYDNSLKRKLEDMRSHLIEE